MSELHADLDAHGFVRLPAAEMRERLGVDDATWNGFAASWNVLEPDGFMADGGLYRRRRYAVATLEEGGLIPQAPQPHFQSELYNPLNGGVERWYEEIPAQIVLGEVMAGAVGLCGEVFGLTGHAWRVEMHQFRIEAREGAPGLPTPEGVHRDGVDWVLVMLVARRNVASGVTAIFDPERRPLGVFTLEQPMDAVLLDDHRVLHGVTPITPERPGEPAYRDVLVVTFSRR